MFPENGENEGGTDSEYHFGEIQVNGAFISLGIFVRRLIILIIFFIYLFYYTMNRIIILLLVILLVVYLNNASHRESLMVCVQWKPDRHCGRYEAQPPPIPPPPPIPKPPANPCILYKIDGSCCRYKY